MAYLRTSSATNVGADKDSDKRQRAAIEAFAKRAGLTIGRVLRQGRERCRSEKVSSVAERAQLDAALDYTREDDTLVVTKLDRIARSVSHLVVIGERLETKGVALKVLDQAIDTSNCTGRLMFNMLGAIAQFERELMLERQREGIAKAKAEGKYRGRAPTARAKAAEVRRLRGEGIGPTEIAKRLGISRASVYRVLNPSV